MKISCSFDPSDAIYVAGRFNHYGNLEIDIKTAGVSNQTIYVKRSRITKLIKHLQAALSLPDEELRNV